MGMNLERKDKTLRDIIEGPPRGFESEPKSKFESKSERAPKNAILETGNETQKPAKGIHIKPDNAHRVALGLLGNQIFVDKIKQYIKERLARGEKITRLDKAIDQSTLDREPYGLSREHLVETIGENFLKFELMPDGDDLAMVFTKSTGDKAMRPLDDETLAEMLNKIFVAIPDLIPLSLEQEESFSNR